MPEAAVTDSHAPQASSRPARHVPEGSGAAHTLLQLGGSSARVEGEAAPARLQPREPAAVRTARAAAPSGGLGARRAPPSTPPTPLVGGTAGCMGMPQQAHARSCRRPAPAQPRTRRGPRRCSSTRMRAVAAQGKAPRPSRDDPTKDPWPAPAADCVPAAAGRPPGGNEGASPRRSPEAGAHVPSGLGVRSGFRHGEAA